MKKGVCCPFPITMPIQRDTPRLNTKRTLLYALEKTQLCHLDEDLMLGFTLKLWMDRRRERWGILLSENGMPAQIAKMV